jgi:hypothetical protein
MPSRRAVIHKKPGFTSFYNLEELRAKKKQEELSKTQGQLQEEQHKQNVMTGSGESSEEEAATQDQQEPESSLESSSDNSSLSPDQTGPTRSNSGSPNKPYYVPLQRKGMAQIWKTITNDLDRTERSLNDADNSESLELKDSSIKATSKEGSTTLAETEK